MTECTYVSAQRPATPSAHYMLPFPQVKGYPTLKVYHKGEEVKAYRGGRDLDALKAYIEEAAGELLVETTE